MKILLLLLLLTCFACCVWPLRKRRWSRIQVRVLSTTQEITGYADSFATGFLHAELEYWLADRFYQVKWRTELAQANFLPGALWMCVPPNQAGKPELIRSIFPPILGLCGSVIAIIVLLSFD